MRKHIKSMSAAALFAASLAAPALAQPATAITYQGRLQLSGVAVNATADFQFRLFTAPTGGSQIGSMQERSGLTVADGMVTAVLDFGNGAFTGEARYLEIAVRAAVHE